MARDPLAWQPLLRQWTRCLGAGGTALEGLGDLAAIEGLNLAELLLGARLAGSAHTDECKAPADAHGRCLRERDMDYLGFWQHKWTKRLLVRRILAG